MTLASYLNGQFSLLQNLEFFARILLACLCGACIGFERSKRLKEAGIRTHIIVCCAAALMIIVSKYGFADLTSLDGSVFNGTRGADPARIAAQVVSGVSFLGAGVIFKNGSTIKGLTTAAGIWATAGIGLAIGAGMYILGIFSTALVALLQILMHKFVVGADSLATNHLRFTIRSEESFQAAFHTYLAENKVQILESTLTYGDRGQITCDLVLRSPRNISACEWHDFLKANGELSSISYTPAG